MALGAKHSFEMHRGDSRVLTYTVVDQQSTPVVVDITTATIEWELAVQDPAANEPQPKEASTLLAKSVGSGIVITDGPNGEFEVTLASADTTGRKAPADFYHEIQMTLAGLVTTLIRGIITLKREVIDPGA